MKNFFKTKKGVKTSVGIVAALVAVVSTISIMVPSYVAYKKYYDAAIAERDHQKYLNSLPLEFLGISAELSDGKEYYTDGKAHPENEDFTVTAHFTEKGKDFDKILRTDDFVVTTPEDFASKGGKIVVSYTYTPEKTKEDDPEPEPITKTDEIEISLTKVIVKSLEITQLPYRVYYSDDMEFDPTGIKVKAIFNNGHTVELNDKDIAVNTKGKLSSSLEAAQISYTCEEVTVTTDVPIKVDTKTNYVDGDILSISTEDEVFVNDGDILSDITLNIRANYENGNKLLLPHDKYVVEGNMDKASFASNCVLNISLKNNKDVSCKVVATVKRVIEMENTTLVGGTKKTITDNNKDIQIVEGFENGNSISFTINSTNNVKGDLSMRMSNLSNTGITLDNIMTLKINGRYNPIISSIASSETYSFEKLILTNALLKTGENKIEITFKNMKDINVAIDSASFQTKYDGVLYANLDQYLEKSLSSGNTIDLKVSAVGNWDGTGGAYGHGLCSDGTYLYAPHTGYSESTRKIVVNKYDPSTGKVLKSSPATEQGALESTAGITYYDGKIIVYFANGKCMAIDSSLDGNWNEYDYGFKGLEKSIFKDVYFNSSKKQFAILSGESIYIYKNDRTAKTSFALMNETGGSIKRITGTPDYIYAVFSKDGAYKPIVHMYDWEGNFKGKIIIPNSNEVMGNVVTKLSNTNVQGLVVFNDSLYFNVLKFSTANGGDSTLIIKADYPKLSEKLEFNFTIGEYIDYCNDKSLTPTLDSESLGALNDVAGGYAMGGCSDGKYIYAAVNVGGNNVTRVHKYDLNNGKLVAASKNFNVATMDGDNSRLFIKDGIIYCIGKDSEGKYGKLFELALDKFDENATFKESTLSFESLGALKSAQYNQNFKKFALMVDNKLVITDEKQNVLCEGKTLSYPGFGASSLTADDKYIYVSYVTNNRSDLPMDVFDWEGNKIKTVLVPNFGLENNSSGGSVNFNVQCIFIHNGKLYASVCSWDSGANKYNLFKINFDKSVLE